MSEYGNYPKCVECDRYELLEQCCGVDKTPRHPLLPQCETYRHETTPPEVMQDKLYNLALLLSDVVGGKYYSLVPMCFARKGICPKGKEGKCKYNKEITVIVEKDGEKVIQTEIKSVNCEFKDKFENPIMPS